LFIVSSVKVSAISGKKTHSKVILFHVSLAMALANYSMVIVPTVEDQPTGTLLTSLLIIEMTRAETVE
jgi:hypothetical protein